MKVFKSFREFSEFLKEGVHDPGIFKVVFTAGGPGSGKSFIAGKAGLGKFSSFGMKTVNSDIIFAKLLRDARVEPVPEQIFSPKGQEIRGHAKELTQKRQKGWLQGRLGMVVDGTGKDYKKIKQMSDALRSIGYASYMLFVNTSLDVALQRNEMRTRKLDATDVENMWKAVQENMGKFQLLFGRKNFILIDNNSASEDVFDKLFVQIKTLVDDPVTSKAALAWIRSQLPD
jgi:dephospho-CoA kinase